MHYFVTDFNLCYYVKHLNVENLTKKSFFKCAAIIGPRVKCKSTMLNHCKKRNKHQQQRKLFTLTDKPILIGVKIYLRVGVQFYCCLGTCKWKGNLICLRFNKGNTYFMGIRWD